MEGAQEEWRQLELKHKNKIIEVGLYGLSFRRSWSTSTCEQTSTRKSSRRQ